MEDRCWKFYIAQQYNKALSCYEQSLEQNPNNPLQWYMKGLVLQSLRRLSEAFECFERSVQLYDQEFATIPQNADGWYTHGNALALLGHYEAALSSYERSIASGSISGPHKRQANVWFAKRDILLHLGRKQEADAAYEEAQFIRNDANYIDDEWDIE